MNGYVFSRAVVKPPTTAVRNGLRTGRLTARLRRAAGAIVAGAGLLLASGSAEAGNFSFGGNGGGSNFSRSLSSMGSRSSSSSNMNQNSSSNFSTKSFKFKSSGNSLGSLNAGGSSSGRRFDVKVNRFPLGSSNSLPKFDVSSSTKNSLPKFGKFDSSRVGRVTDLSNASGVFGKVKKDGLNLNKIGGLPRNELPKLIGKHDFTKLGDKGKGIKLSDLTGKPKFGKIDLNINKGLGITLGKHTLPLLKNDGKLVNQIKLLDNLKDNGGWKHRFCGPIDPHFSKHCFTDYYCGSYCFPSKCYYPHWCGWVDWCVPSYCYHYDPCHSWVVYYYPVWKPLYVIECGTYIDAPVVVVDSGKDLQLLAVRFVDGGHPEKKLGPRYRMFLRNNGKSLDRTFHVMAMVAKGNTPSSDLPRGGAKVEGLEAGKTLAVDVRLPFEAVNPELSMLHVLVDSHREISEAFEDNNGAVLAREDVLPVDPVVYKADAKTYAGGDVINLSGEGLGPEAGQVVVKVGGLTLQAEIQGWFDLGARAKLPSLPLSATMDAELIVVRGDGATANPVTIELTAAEFTAAAATATADYE